MLSVPAAHPRRTPDPKLSTSPVLTAEFSLRWAGTWDPLLQRLHLDTPFLAQQNTKKLSGVKHCCVHAPLGQILDKRYKKTKNANATSEKQEAKAGSPPTNAPPPGPPPKGWADHLRHPSSPTPRYSPTLAPL